jgi:hypothetical protein
MKRLVLLAALSTLALGCADHQKPEPRDWSSAVTHAGLDGADSGEQIRYAMEHGFERGSAGFHLLTPYVPSRHRKDAPPSSDLGLHSPNGRWSFYPVDLVTPLQLGAMEFDHMFVSIPRAFPNEFFELRAVANGSTWDVVVDVSAEVHEGLRSFLYGHRAFGRGFDWYSVYHADTSGFTEMRLALVADDRAYEDFSVNELVERPPGPTVVAARLTKKDARALVAAFDH